jgi:hypothetical protein
MALRLPTDATEVIWMMGDETRENRAISGVVSMKASIRCGEDGAR